MFVQISPSDNDLSETLSSLNFATRVGGVELGPARKHIDTIELQKMKMMAIHGEDGKVGQNISSRSYSCWLNIVKEDNWINDGVLKDVFPRLYALEMCKKVYVSLKLKDSSLETSFRRKVYLSLEGSGDFSVASIRKVIDDKFLPNVSSKTRWVKYVPIKEWLNWLGSLRLPAKLKLMLEGVFYVVWWYIWSHRNKTIFESKAPLKSIIFDDVISSSFYWCRFRSKICKTRTFALGDKPHFFFAPEGKPPRRGLNPRPLACGNNLPKVTLSGHLS
nr:RNA-directed DNA polymerase, eukaryota [Tanacetum cinerariifolium]